MNPLSDFSMAPISKDEIQWVKSKHISLLKASLKTLRDALEIGDWFNEAEGRTGYKKSTKGGRGGMWLLWLKTQFPEMTSDTIARYQRLARNRLLLDKEFGLNLDATSKIKETVTIGKALHFLAERARQKKQSQIIDVTTKIAGTGPLELEDPLLALRDKIKSYVYDLYQLKYREAEIAERIKVAKLSKAQVRQAIEWSCREHPEILEDALKAFLG